MRAHFNRGVKISGGATVANYRTLLAAASGRDDGLIDLSPKRIRIGESSLISGIVQDLESKLPH